VTKLLKPFALSVLLSKPSQVILVEDGEPGYAPFGEPFASAIDAAAYADSDQRRNGRHASAARDLHVTLDGPR
jgi:hypothetical protein